MLWGTKAGGAGAAGTLRKGRGGVGGSSDRGRQTAARGTGERERPRRQREGRGGAAVCAADCCECREILGVQGRFRPGTGAIHRERMMRSRFSAPQARCWQHLAWPGRNLPCAPEFPAAFTDARRTHSSSSPPFPLPPRPLPLPCPARRCLPPSAAASACAAPHLPRVPAAPAPPAFCLVAAVFGGMPILFGWWR